MSSPTELSEQRRRPSGAALSRSAEEPASRHDEVTFLAIGRVVGVRGLRGELRLSIETDDPQHVLELQQLYLGEEHMRMRVRAARLMNGQMLVRLVGIDTREDAEALRGLWAYVHVDDARPLGEGVYYHHQIIGLSVITDEGEEMGVVTDVLATGANDVYVVQGPGGEILLPAIKQVILEVALEAGTLRVHLIEGLR